MEGGLRLAIRGIDESRLDRLKSLLQNLPQLGIRFYMVGTKEGLSVVSDGAAGMPDADLLSAATATMLSTGDFLSDKYREGVTKEIMMRVEHGYILLFRVGSSHNLAAVVGDVTNLDYYLDILRKYTKAVEEVVLPGEQVKEAEEMLRRELDMIGVSAEVTEKPAEPSDSGSQSEKQPAPKGGRKRRMKEGP